jgi:hypothetical protein
MMPLRARHCALEDSLRTTMPLNTNTIPDKAQAWTQHRSRTNMGLYRAPAPSSAISLPCLWNSKSLSSCVNAYATNMAAILGEDEGRIDRGQHPNDINRRLRCLVAALERCSRIYIGGQRRIIWNHISKYHTTHSSSKISSDPSRPLLPQPP